MTKIRIMREVALRARLYEHVRSEADLASYPDRENFLDAWYNRMERRVQLANRFKWSYFILLTVNAAAAASVPALIAAAGSSHDQSATIMRFTAAALGVGIAVVTSILGVVQIGARWQVYRIYGEAMEDAAWAFVNDPGNAAGYSKFVAAVNIARRNYEREYIKDIVAVDSKSPAGSNP